MLIDIVSPVACFFSWFCQLTLQLTVSTFSTSLRSRAEAATTVQPPPSARARLRPTRNQRLPGVGRNVEAELQRARCALRPIDRSVDRDAAQRRLAEIDLDRVVGHLVRLKILDAILADQDIGNIDLVRDAINRPERRTRLKHGVRIIERVGIDPDRIVIGPHLQRFGLRRFQRDEIGRARGEHQRHQFLIDVGRHADQPAVKQRDEIGAILPRQPSPDAARRRQQADARILDIDGQARKLALGMLDPKRKHLLIFDPVLGPERSFGVGPGKVERSRHQTSSSCSCQLTAPPYSSRVTEKPVTRMVRIGR